jgi:transcriptional regulator with PAS, ATPase and Fis domain
MHRILLMTDQAAARLTAPVVGRSPAMLRVLERTAAIAESEAPVLLTGDSGTGKELLARTIHGLSSRRLHPLVTMNCAALPDALIEAELFGYERGAFTGALHRREGRFKAADGGTLFLDEINGLSLAAQAKLLHVLQDGGFQPLGQNATCSVNVRLISATNQSLRALVADGRFREDLYYRIKVLDIDLPPLRERRGDLPLLVHHFILKHTIAGREPATITPRAWAAFSHHAFPGNVRELEHAIVHALVLSRGHAIDLEHLPAELCPAASPAAMAGAGELSPLHEAVGEFEREYVARALQLTGGNKTRAARLLGISRKSLWEKLRKQSPLVPFDEPAPESDDEYQH